MAAHILCFLQCALVGYARGQCHHWLRFGFGWGLDLVEVWIWLRIGFGWGLDLVEVKRFGSKFGFGWGSDLVEVWIWLRFGFSWGLDLVEEWIWLRFGIGGGLDLVRFGFGWVELSWVGLGGLVWFGLAVWGTYVRTGQHIIIGPKSTPGLVGFGWRWAIYKL